VEPQEGATMSAKGVNMGGKDATISSGIGGYRRVSAGIGVIGGDRRILGGIGGG